MPYHSAKKSQIGQDVSCTRVKSGQASFSKGSKLIGQSLGKLPKKRPKGSQADLAKGGLSKGIL